MFQCCFKNKKPRDCTEEVHNSKALRRCYDHQYMRLLRMLHTMKKSPVYCAHRPRHVLVHLKVRLEYDQRRAHNLRLLHRYWPNDQEGNKRGMHQKEKMRRHQRNVSPAQRHTHTLPRPRPSRRREFSWHFLSGTGFKIMLKGVEVWGGGAGGYNNHVRYSINSCIIRNVLLAVLPQHQLL